MNSSTEYMQIQESVLSYNHKSGLKAYVVPKKGYQKKHAAICVNYGSVDTSFKENNLIKTMPQGIAHFLEHKLFEQEDGNVLNKFTNNGAQPNAYTGFNQTVYLFSTTENFYKNLDILLDFVQNPYFTDENVEKEKDIIKQEISMYRDDSSWRLFFNLLNALYENNTVKYDIAGSHDSIDKITKDMLYESYNAFYRPSNMFFIAVGDIDSDVIFQAISEKFDYKPDCSKKNIQKYYPNRDKIPFKRLIEQSMPVSSSKFQIGYLIDKIFDNGLQLIEFECSVRILMEILLGRSSKLYSELYNDGLLNSNFEMDLSVEPTHAHIVFGGECSKSEMIVNKLNNRIRYLSEKGINSSYVDRVRKASYGRFVRMLNSVEKVAHGMASVCFKDVNLFDYLNAYDKISSESINKLITECFGDDNMSLSLINPI